jgi:hypothetical protein
MIKPEPLTAKDFMAMDVHRPLTDDEINATQAVDKTIGAGEEELSDAPSVDSSVARCEFCFGPRPCPQHPNVEPLSVVTSHDMPATAVLAGAHSADLACVVVVGLTKDGHEYFASTNSDAAESMYHLQRGIHKLNCIVDEGSGTNEHPKDSA